MTYTLKPVLPGETFARVYQGRRWVGRVWQHATTRRWHGKIGEHEGEGATTVEAFQEAGARALGFKSAWALRESNAAVRKTRTRRREGARLVAAGMMSRDRATREAAFDVFFDVLTGERSL